MISALIWMGFKTLGRPVSSLDDTDSVTHKLRSCCCLHMGRRSQLMSLTRT